MNPMDFAPALHLLRQGIPGSNRGYCCSILEASARLPASRQSSFSLSILLPLHPLFLRFTSLRPKRTPDLPPQNVPAPNSTLRTGLSSHGIRALPDGLRTGNQKRKPTRDRTSKVRSRVGLRADGPAARRLSLQQVFRHQSPKALCSAAGGRCILYFSLDSLSSLARTV